MAQDGHSLQTEIPVSYTHLDVYKRQQYNPHHDKDVFYHSLCVMENSPPILEIRLAALLHDIGKPKAFTLDEEGVGPVSYTHLDVYKRQKLYSVPQ